MYIMILKQSRKLFAHVDCDSFFASCEIMRNPSWEGKCVCVGRDVIIAANYHAKRRGVKVGMPNWIAKQFLPPDTIYKYVDFELYGQVSRKIMAYLREQTLCVEEFSIDEAFCEISGLPELF